MPYLTSVSEIIAAIDELTSATTLWIDTEVADYNTSKPRLSLIQVLDDAKDLTGERIFLLDVLDKPKVITEFINKIMLNPDIEKVFHNANFDIKLLGNNKTKNVTCTLEIARKIPYYLLQVPNYQLKTLATELCNFRDISKSEQKSDWGQRPLTEEQIEYAYLDCIYLAQVHQRLLELNVRANLDPAQEDLRILGERYLEIHEQWHLLDSEIKHIKEKAKLAMQAQNISETYHFKLSNTQRNTKKVSFYELAKFAYTHGLELNFPITITHALQKDIGKILEQLPVEIEQTNNLRLTAKNIDGEELEE